MSEPEGSNNPTDIPNPTDSAPAPPSEPGPSAPAAQAPGAQAPLPNRVNPQVSAAQPAKTVFGLRQDANHYQAAQNVVFPDDYEKLLPEDPYGEETAPNARIWRVYNEEADAYDAVYVGQARDGLDVMLVFAGLFSAVVTSFLVQVSQSLQADYTSMSAILLYDLVTVQLSIADGPSSRPNITVPSINPSQPFRPASITVWVNGLWVVSLAMSLVVALSAVLVKQWFHHYTSVRSGTPAARSHLRQYRFDGLQKWRVNVIIGLLPIIMHISLVLFLVGLMLFFIPLCTSLAYAVGVITVVLCLLYLISSALPIFFPQCPYQTPLTDFVFHTCLLIRKAPHSIPRFIRALAYDMLQVCRRWLFRYLHLHTPHIMFSRACYKRPEHSESSRTLNQLEKFMVEPNYGKVSVDALDWLFNNSSNPTVHSLVVQAIGGLPPDVGKDARANWHNQNEIKDVLEQCFIAIGDSQRCVIESDSVRERLMRSRYFFNCAQWYFFSLPRVYKAEFNEPCFTATVWAATNRDVDQPSRDLRKFFCTHHELKLHPFVWEGLVQSALESNSYCFQVNSLQDLSNPDYAHIISLFLPASKLSNESDKVSDRPRIGHSCTVTLHDALTLYLGNRVLKSVQDCLLDMLSFFEDDLPATLPPYYRILYKASQFVRHYLADQFWVLYRDAGSCCHLELLLTVLRSLYDEYDTILEDHPCFFAPIHELLRTIIDDTPICEYYTADMQHSTLHAQLEDSRRAMSCLLTRTIWSHQPKSIIPSFHRLLQVPAHYNLSEGQGPYTHPTNGMLDLVETALEIGTEAVHRAFIHGEWLWMLAERCIADQDDTHVEPIFTFICGLQALDSVLALKFLDNLQLPRNFKITFIIAAEQTDSEVLLKLCPKDSPLWNTHRATLDGILDWCQASNRNDLPCPFDNLFNGEVVSTDDGAVSLDEVLRNMFARDRCRRNVKWAANTIILGEADPDFPFD